MHLRNHNAARSAGSVALGVFLAAGLAAPAHAQWTVIKLHPAWATDSEAKSVYGGQQVGASNTSGHALLWSGSGASVVVLDPTVDGGGSAYSVANGVQGGSVTINPGTVSAQTHASLWSGSAQSWVDLHPTVDGMIHSGVYAVSGNSQGGYFFMGSDCTFSTGLPCMWSGNAASWVDLTPEGYFSGAVLGLSATQQVGATYDTGLAWACLWNGTPESFVNLNPDPNFFSAATCTDGTHQYGTGVIITEAYAGLYPVQWTGTPESMLLLGMNDLVNRWGEVHATHGGWQVGYTTDNDGVSNERACYWTGLPGTFADLNQYLPAGYNGSNALGIWRHASGATYVVGYADNASTGHREAVMWVNSPGVNLITSPSAPADCGAGAGSALVYSVRVLNAGATTSGPVTLTVALPPSGVATYASATPPPSAVTSTQLTFNLGSIAGSGAFADVSITLNAVGAGSTATITATAAAVGEVDPTNNTASASSRIEPASADFARAVGVVCTDPARANSLIPGGAGHYTTLNHPFASPSGNWWIINAVTDLPAGQNTVMVRTSTGGAGSIVAREGVTTFPHGTLSSLAIGGEVNDSGVVAFSGIDNGAPASSVVIATTNGTTITEIARQGNPIPSMPGINYNDVDNSANIFANGQVGFAATTTPSGNSAYLSGNGGTILARLDVTTPAGASAPISKMLFSNTGVWALAFDATGAHSIYQADIGTGDLGNDQVIVADGTLVIQEGITVLPGFSNPVGPGDIGPGNKFLSMGPGGTWMVRGSNIDPAEDWVVRGTGSDIIHVYKTGDPIGLNATETWKEDALVTSTFFAQAADSAGHYIVGGMTDSADDFADSVLVYDNRIVVARENDPVDLDGNGLFDDGVYIRSFDADGVAFVGGGLLAVVTLRDSDAALCHTNNASRGQALIFIPHCAADFNGDGFVDGIDYDQFNNAFEVGDPTADFNGDGFLDGIDYDQFNNAFEGGC